MSFAEGIQVSIWLQARRLSQSCLCLMAAGSETSEPAGGLSTKDLTLDGLGLVWEDDKRIRRESMKEGGKLVHWPDPETHGVVTFKGPIAPE